MIKVPDAKPTQLGFAGVFLPTAIEVHGQLASAFPAALFPRVSLVAYTGNLGMNWPAGAVGIRPGHQAACTSSRISPTPLAPVSP